MNDRPIGVFDSGLGGLSALREFVKYMPEENYIYYGDSANAPYGTRTDEEVIELTEQVFEKLRTLGAKAFVIACNTATSAAAKKLRLKYPEYPIVGMEPALKPAAETCRGGRIVVMATPVTLRRRKFADLMEKYAEESEIISLPCPDIVEYVEQGRLHDEGLRRYVKEQFDTVGGPVDAVVLGCTHFPFAADVIRDVAGPQVQLFDGSAGTARELKKRLEKWNCKSDRTEPGYVKIMNSAGEEMIVRSEKLLSGEALSEDE